MNTLHTLLIATTLALLGTAQAAEADLDHPWGAAALAAPGMALSRADVQATLRAARAAGQIESGEASPVHPHAVSQKSRAQVRAELHEARRLGLLGHGELGLPGPTADEARRIAEAGARAASVMAHRR